MRKCLFIFLTLSGLFLHASSNSQIIFVPDDYPLIQDAINASQSGDTVLVSPGEYFENLNMNGKNILLASHFVIDGDPDYINNTIINGSQPAHPDSASCILIVSGETENCVIAGFTLTGGTGTRWEDEHNLRNWFTEGGGILIQYSSPTIRNNVIRDNVAIKKNQRNVSSGGGAIRMGDSNPKILNNYIHHNQGRYGGGIVLNYSGAFIRNNLIVSNSGGQDFGGGGIWILGNSDDPRIIENNTIVNNSGTNYGGGIRIWMSEVILTNNIIRGNHAKYGPQIHGTGIWTYCNIEGGKEGTGNIDEVVRFDSPLLILPEGDKSIDAGNPHVTFNDPEDPENAGQAMFPAQGILRNDMGCYGGPGTMPFPEPDLSGINNIIANSGNSFNIYPNPAKEEIIISPVKNITGPIIIQILDVSGKLVYNSSLPELNYPEVIRLTGLNLTKGIHFIKFQSNSTSAVKRLIIE